MPIPFPFDFKNPDYTAVRQYRVDKLLKIRQNPSCLPHLKEFYKENIAQFIIDWGTTYDPRATHYPFIPFLLFEKQEEWVNWIIHCWRNNKNALTEKSRDMGLSWLSTSVAASLCVLHDGLSIGFGSMKRENVDQIGDPGSLFDKIRVFLNELPREFNAGFNPKTDSHFMKIFVPSTKCTIIGNSGDDLARGKRFSIFFLDESAFLERPDAVERSLSSCTKCRVDVTTPNNKENPFYRKMYAIKTQSSDADANTELMSIHWRAHPNKDEKWYAIESAKIGDPRIVASELDLDWEGSQEETLIKSMWIQASINAHKKLNIDASGIKTVGLDIADVGKDLNALCARHGILVTNLTFWSGKNSNIFKTIGKAFSFLDEWGYDELIYDADGLGASAGGISEVYNKERNEFQKISFFPFHGSGAVVNPDDNIFRKSGARREKNGRTNNDLFSNRKAQAWFEIRRRFEITYLALNSDYPYDPEDIISIPGDLGKVEGKSVLDILCEELTRPRYLYTNTGKYLIEKMPEGSKSPNLADSLMMAFSPVKRSGYLVL